MLSLWLRYGYYGCVSYGLGVRLWVYSYALVDQISQLFKFMSEGEDILLDMFQKAW